MADEHEQVGAVDVGHRQEELVTVESPCGDVVRQLVHGRRGESVPGAKEPEQGGVVGQRAEAVHVGVAEVDRERVVAVLALHPRDERSRQRDGVVPGDLLEAAVGRAPHRGPEPVGVLVEVLQGERLGADVTPRERVGLVPSHRVDGA